MPQNGQTRSSNYLTVFDHFVALVLKELIEKKQTHKVLLKKIVICNKMVHENPIYPIYVIIFIIFRKNLIYTFCSS